MNNSNTKAQPILNVTETTVLTLIGMAKDFNARIPQMENGIVYAKQHIEGKEAAVRVFKRIIRDTKNEERIKVVTKCLSDAEWELAKYQEELARYESELENIKVLKKDFDLILNAL